MNTNTMRMLALVVLLPALFLALLPPLAHHTNVLNGMQDFRLELFGYLLADFHHDVNGEPSAQSAWPVWVTAIVAEVFLLAAVVFKPVDRNKHKLNLRD